MLKQENSRLKEMGKLVLISSATRVQEVEQLKMENKLMRLELQRMQIEASESGATQNSFFLTGVQDESARLHSSSEFGNNQMISP